ncbi:uncharacterized protein LOC129219914 [Uloborus diversus]|uniref:uncharacterized protein LOC129219914 n=1 Tax=Uloborus diversus TaxID=327109 RepID=UPI0024098B8A|nr:uncharacterized protein LOC129219914 [Uloborus diversus]
MMKRSWRLSQIYNIVPAYRGNDDLIQVILLLCAVAASGQFFQPFFPFFPYFPFRYNFGLPGFEEYAASLGGAKVGLYGRSSGFGGPFLPPFGPFGRLGGSEVTGASLAGAKVGIYGKENSQRSVYG